jgi:hypothetical protein
MNGAVGMKNMAAVTFGSLKFVKTLQVAGVAAPQAEAFAFAVRDSTKSADLAAKADLREPKTELKIDLARLEERMTIKCGAVMAVTIGVIAALVKL